MRFVIAGLLTVTLVGGCGLNSPSARVSRAAVSFPAAPAPAVPPGATRVFGSGYDMRTADLAARVTVTQGAAPADPAGDPAYVVTVTVQVLRGTWEFGPALVRLRNAGGPDRAPIDGGAVPPGAMTLHTGVTRSWRLPFEKSAGAGAQILLTDPAGSVLAAWTTRRPG